MTTKKILGTLCALPLLFLLGCAAEPGEIDPPLGRSAQGLDDLTVDSSALAERPPATIPPDRLPRSAYSQREVVSRLLQTAERFDTVKTVGTRVIQGSPSWYLELDGQRGRILALRKQPPGPPAPQDEAALLERAIARLDGWGLRAGERGRVLQRRAMTRPEDGGTLRPARLHRYKTFVLRGINGVPVEGNRAVVSHAPDGTLQRVLVEWPALAGSGHKLRTGLRRAQIEQRAIEALRAAGETAGQAWLHWKYVPELLASGEAVLVLKVGARVAARDVGPVTEEPREIEVDVSAVP